MPLLKTCKQKSYFRTLTEIYHPELCEGLYQNERSRFVRYFFIETKFFVYWGTYNDSSSSKISLGLDCFLPKN